METIRKTVESKYAPKQTNVIWVDTSGDTPVEKHFIKGKWREMSGGGAGSSNPTEADATKIWQVTPVLKETKTEETVIVPEQTLVNGQELEYNDKFIPGVQCIAIVNSVEYRGEVVDNGKGAYIFQVNEFISFEYESSEETFQFWDGAESPEVTAKLSIIEETPIYDYNWAPGVKIPIPTAEDEGKILVVTKVEGDNTSIIVPEQQVPIRFKVPTPLTNVDLTKFVVGNTVRVTVSANSQTFTATGVIEESEGIVLVSFNIDGDSFTVNQEDNLLYTNAVSVFGINSTIKLEYIEFNYEYQLQENSGGGNSDVLWPAVYEYNGNEIMATFVPENVEPNTWCMVYGVFNSDITCLPVRVIEFGNYAICNITDNSIKIVTYSVDGGELLILSTNDQV